MDLALRVLFHRFQIIFDRIRLTLSVAIGTIKINKCNTAVSTVNTREVTSQSLGDRVRELIIYKHQFLHSDWLRACQLIPNQCKKVKLSARR